MRCAGILLVVTALVAALSTSGSAERRWRVPSEDPAPDSDVAEGWLYPILHGPPLQPPFDAAEPASAGPSQRIDGIWDLLPLPSSVPRHSHSLIYDPVGDRLIAFGGSDNRTGTPYRAHNDVYELSLANPVEWKRMSVAGTPPSPRAFHTAIYDPIRDRMIVFGGVTPPGGYQNDTWALSLSGTPTWTLLSPPGELPAPRALHVALYDPVGDRMIIQGGAGTRYWSGTWALSLSNPVWSGVTGGPLVHSHTAIYDQVRETMVVYGGWNNERPGNEVTMLPLYWPHWMEVHPSPPMPLIPYGHAAIYDPVGDRLLLWQTSWGGVIGTWGLSLGTKPPGWTQLRTLADPTQRRYFYATAYDPGRHRLIIHGGQNQSASGQTRALSLCFPVAIDVRPGTDDNVIPLRSHGLLRVALLGSEEVDATAVDAARVRFAEAGVVYEDGLPKRQFQDVDGDGRTDLVLWFPIDSLALAESDTVAHLTARLSGERLGCGSDRVRVVPPTHAWQTDLESGAAPAPADGLTLRVVRGDAGSSPITVEFSIPGGGAATLELLDLSGRRLASRRLSGPRPSPTLLELEETAGVPSGLYFVRLSLGARTRTAKAFVIR